MSKIEDEKITNQIVGISKSWDQNGDRVSKYAKSCHVCSIKLKGLLMKCYCKVNLMEVVQKAFIACNEFLMLKWSTLLAFH